MKSQETKKPEHKQEDTSSKEQNKDEKDSSEEQERNGIIPEDLDFKKFLGCGG